MFPDPYPDELFYSICARFAEQLHYPSVSRVVQELFGAKIRAVIDLPSHLADLVERLPPGHSYTVARWIDEHTLLPFYAPFLPTSRLCQLRVDMAGHGGCAISMRAGIMGSSISTPSELRYCPICVNDDRQDRGEAYWHRVHQVAGVIVCPSHGQLLQNSGVRCSNRTNLLEYVTAETAISSLERVPLALDNITNRTLWQLARNVSWLLSPHRSLGIRPENRRQLYIRLLAERGLATYRGTARLHMLTEALVTYYGDVLGHIGCEFHQVSGEHWLARLLHTPGTGPHPIHHLLLIGFLGYTTEEFWSLSSEKRFFGESPWPCLNNASDHYGQERIADCVISYTADTRQPIGTFRCDCGFVYRRSGPDKTLEDRLRISRMVSFGLVWEERLRACSNDTTMTLTEAARQLGVDPITIKRQSLRLGIRIPSSDIRLKPSWSPKQTHIPVANNPDLGQKHRANWLIAIEANPGIGIKQLRRLYGATYAWLYRHDRNWLNDHKPIQVSKQFQILTRVDWVSRDMEVESAINAAAERLYDRSIIKNSKRHHARLTRTALAREAGYQGLLNHHLDKLPRTALRLQLLLGESNS